MDEWLQPYDVPPAEQQEVEVLDKFLVDTLARFIRERLPGEADVLVGSIGSTARGTQSPTRFDFDLAVVGIDPERHHAALNAALDDLRNEMVHAVCFQDFALRIFDVVLSPQTLIVEPFRRRLDFDLWQGLLVVNVGGRHTKLVDIVIEQEGSIGLWYTSWIRKEMAQMSPNARRCARASSRLFKDVMRQLGAYELRTGGVRGIVAELLIIQLDGDFMTVMDKMYINTIVHDARDGKNFGILPQAKVALAWRVENPHPKRAAPHPFYNLLMHLDHGEPAQSLPTNGWNWRVLATLAYCVHWMRLRREPLDVAGLVRDVEKLVGAPRPRLPGDSVDEQRDRPECL